MDSNAREFPFPRPSNSSSKLTNDLYKYSVVAVNGAHINPLIQATKGENFNLNVVNNLNSSTMLRSTSVVSPPLLTSNFWC